MTEKLLTLPLRIGFGAARTTFGITTKVVGTAIKLVRPGSRHETPPPPARPSEPERRPQEAARATAPVREAPPARGRGERRDNGQPEAAAPSTPPATPPTPPAAPPAARPAAPAPAPPPPALTDVTPPAEQPDTPLTSAEEAAKTVDDQDEVVATFAESGAEEGAGAQLDIEAPWEGYAEMKADAVIARIGEADAAELAVVELFESTHKKRQTVLNAAARRLKALSPPPSE